MSSWVRLVALFGAVGLWAVPACTPRALARPPRRVSLQYTRAENALACVDPVTLARKVEAFTGPVLVAPASAEAVLEAHVQARASMGFRVRIQLSREREAPHGERILEVDSPDCRSFDDALAFVIATTIDPDLVLERVGALFAATATPPNQALLEELTQPTPAPSRSETRVPPPSTPKKGPPPIVPEKRVAPSPPLSLGVGITASNELPVPALGPAVLVRYPVLHWLELGAGGRAMFGLHDKQLEGTASATTWQFSGALLLCPRAPWGKSLVASLCVGPELSVLRVAGHGFEESRTDVNTTLGLAVRPELALRVSSVSSLRLSAFVRMGGRNQLTSVQDGAENEFFVTPLATVGGELSVSRAF